MDILLMFVVLIGSFAAVGLLIPFSDQILRRPIDDAAANNPRDGAQHKRNESLSRTDGQHSRTRATGN